MDITRFFQIYIVLILFGAFYLYIGYRIIKRGRSRMNFFIGGFYFCSAIGTIMNIIYASIFSSPLVYFLYSLTVLVLSYALLFVLLFLLLLYKSNMIIGEKYVITILILFGMLHLGLWLIPYHFKINAGTDWKPIWSPLGYVYIFLLLMCYIISPSAYISFKLYKQFENKRLKKRWKIFMIGMYCAFILYLGGLFSSMIHIQPFRDGWSVISFVLVILSGFFMYYGIARDE